MTGTLTQDQRRLQIRDELTNEIKHPSVWYQKGKNSHKPTLRLCKKVKNHDESS